MVLISLKIFRVSLLQLRIRVYTGVSPAGLEGNEVVYTGRFLEAESKGCAPGGSLGAPPKLLSHFVIADLTRPSSVQLELETIIPTLPIAVQAILARWQERELSMFSSLSVRYDWVLPIY